MPKIKNKLAVIIKEFEDKCVKRKFNVNLNEKVLILNYSGWNRRSKGTLKFRVINEKGHIKKAFVSQIKILPDELQLPEEIQRYKELRKENVKKIQEERYFPIIAKVLKIDRSFNIVQLLAIDKSVYWVSLKIIPLTKLKDLEESCEKEEYMSINIPSWLHYKKYGQHK